MEPARDRRCGVGRPCASGRRWTTGDRPVRAPEGAGAHVPPSRQPGARPGRDVHERRAGDPDRRIRRLLRVAGRRAGRHRPAGVSPHGLAEPDQPSVQRGAAHSSTGATRPTSASTMVALPAGAAAAAPPRRRARRPGGTAHRAHPGSRPTSGSGRGGRGARRRRIRGTNLPGGLDGIAIDLPALNVTPTHGAYFPLQHPGEGSDLAAAQHARRQRLGEAGRAAHRLARHCATGSCRTTRASTSRIAGAGAGLRRPPRSTGPRSAWSSRHARDALAEHARDRFTQVRDNYAHIVEESPRTRAAEAVRALRGRHDRPAARGPRSRARPAGTGTTTTRSSRAPPVTLATPPAGRAAVGVPADRAAAA